MCFGSKFYGDTTKNKSRAHEPDVFQSFLVLCLILKYVVAILRVENTNLLGL